MHVLKNIMEITNIYWIKYLDPEEGYLKISFESTWNSGKCYRDLSNSLYHNNPTNSVSQECMYIQHNMPALQKGILYQKEYMLTLPCRKALNVVEFQLFNGLNLGSKDVQGQRCQATNRNWKTSKVLHGSQALTGTSSLCRHLLHMWSIGEISACACQSIAQAAHIHGWH